MPILAGIPVRTPDPIYVDPFEESRTLSFRSLDGMDLLPFTGKEFFARQGITGLDLPPREVIRDKVPGMDGTRIREVQVGERVVFLPLFIASNASHVGYLDNRDRIAALLNHRLVDFAGSDGTFDLVARSARGERALRCMYLEGMEGERGESSGAWYESTGLSLLATQPYWRGARWETPVIRKPADVSWFSDFPPALSATRALGANIPVTVLGDADSYVSIDLVGPATSVLITAPNLSFSLPAGLASGETATIVTNVRGRSISFNGVKAAANWSRVAPGDFYNPLPPGDRLINVTMTGATLATSAQVYGDTLYERWC